MRRAAAGHIVYRSAALAVLFVLAAVVSGCSGGSLSGMFSGSGGGSSSSLAPVSFSPDIIGPPKAISSQLTTELVTAAKQKNIPVVTVKGQPSTYTVQGYLAQSNENRSEKFSYILDVTDKSGKRVHRILGEEAVPAKPGAKPWSSINQTAMQKIAVKTATDLATWLPTHGGGTTRVSSPASPASTSSRTSVLTSRDAPPPPPPPASRGTPTQTASAPPRATTTTNSKSFAVLVPPVAGAPGDGRTSLTNALRERLRARGVHVAATGGKDVYRVQGKVSIGPAPGSMQRVRVEWRLISPTGEDLGAVTQQGNVPKGSLNKTWGKTAQDLGNAASSEIIKLQEKGRG